MLRKLSISNYALIELLQLELEPGLNIITGETGAGKSIIIGAIQLLLGARAKPQIVRSGASKLVIEGEFLLNDTFDISGFDGQFDWWDDGLLLRREINASGRSRCFINDSPMSLTQMAAMGDLLVDLHGQHDHQSLLKAAYHGTYLDAFGIDLKIRTNMSETFKQFKEADTAYKNFLAEEIEMREKHDFLQFQLREIQEVHPEPDEEESLLKEERILSNSEKIFELVAMISGQLYDDQNAVTPKLSYFEESLSRLKNIDEQFDIWSKQCESARIQLEELVTELQSFASRIDFDPERLESLRLRLGSFSTLKKKYGRSIKDVLDMQQRIQSDLNQIEHVDEHLENLKHERSTTRERLIIAAEELSRLRKVSAKTLERSTITILKQLGLEQAQFSIKIDPRYSDQGNIRHDGQRVIADANGMDRIQFYVSLNIGQELAPLDKVASGGEISRIMLALKSALAKADQIPVLIFDEIDSGISGRIGRIVGRRLEELATQHQILCITHLPQIASMGDSHFQVLKTTQNNEAITSLRTLSSEERVHEIAKLLAGNAITEQSLESARELLEKVDIICS
ncbi:DNA repair protein RecN [bacterium]|nr:DNA repair protein RecN [bacterium]